MTSCFENDMVSYDHANKLFEECGGLSDVFAVRNDFKIMSVSNSNILPDIFTVEVCNLLKSIGCAV